MTDNSYGLPRGARYDSADSARQDERDQKIRDEIEQLRQEIREAHQQIGERLDRLTGRLDVVTDDGVEDVEVVDDFSGSSGPSVLDVWRIPLQHYPDDVIDKLTLRTTVGIPTASIPTTRIDELQAALDMYNAPTHSDAETARRRSAVMAAAHRLLVEAGRRPS